MSQEQEIVAWVERQYSTPKKTFEIGPIVFGVVACAAVLWLVGRPRETSAPSPAPVAEYHTLAERIAFADRGNYDASAITPLLRRLANKFSTSDDEIANATFAVQGLLQSKYAAAMSMEEIMSMADESVIDTTSLSYREVLGTYLGLRESRNHSQAVSTMRALWADLGL